MPCLSNQVLWCATEASPPVLPLMPRSIWRLFLAPTNYNCGVGRWLALACAGRVEEVVKRPPVSFRQEIWKQRSLLLCLFVYYPLFMPWRKPIKSCNKAFNSTIPTIIPSIQVAVMSKRQPTPVYHWWLQKICFAARTRNLNIVKRLYGRHGRAGSTAAALNNTRIMIGLGGSHRLKNRRTHGSSNTMDIARAHPPRELCDAIWFYVCIVNELDC